MSAHGMSWDWRGQPDLNELDRILANETGLKIRVYAIDTGGDQYGVLIVANEPELTQAQANERWQKWWRSER